MASLLISAATAALVLYGLVLFLLWAGGFGAIGILSAVGLFLAWFYRGKRPDMTLRGDYHEGD